MITLARGSDNPHPQGPDLVITLHRHGTTATADFEIPINCDVISINGPSYRLKNRLAAIERDRDDAA